MDLPVVEIQNLTKNCNEILILSILHRSKKHGYQLALEIEEKSEGRFKFNHGTLYPILHKLEKEGIIKSEKDGAFKRFYPVMTKNRGKSVLALSEIRQHIIKILRESPGSSLTEISFLLDQDVQKIDYHLRRMEEEGIVIKTKNQVGHTMYYLSSQVRKPIPKVGPSNTSKSTPVPQPQTTPSPR